MRAIFDGTTSRATFHVLDAFDDAVSERNLGIWDTRTLEERARRIPAIVELIMGSVHTLLTPAEWDFRHVECAGDVNVMDMRPSVVRALAQQAVDRRWEGFVLKNTDSMYLLSNASDRMPLNEWAKVRPDLMAGWHFPAYAVGCLGGKDTIVLALQDAAGAFQIISASCRVEASALAVLGAMYVTERLPAVTGQGAWRDAPTIEYIPFGEPIVVNAVFDYRHTPPERQLAYARVFATSDGTPCRYEDAAAASARAAVDAMQPSI